MLGSHQQYKHPTKPGEVKMYRFLVVIEKANKNYSAYSPDLPGCVATGATREEAENNMYGAIEMHIQGLLEDKFPIPESKSFAKYIAVAEKPGVGQTS
ncbi:MAG: type II toxin-antitoxin system HicB family antitoxin [Candidatus Methanoperedens sp.]|nr:type II toxin-antitoxin system HicB family antitoxin [Candidatus Methanoperedens sp.]